MDAFGPNNCLDLAKCLQYFNEETFQKSWSPAKSSSSPVTEIHNLQPLDLTWNGRSQFNGLIWNSSEGDIATAGCPDVLKGPPFASVLQVAGHTYNDFAKNGIESELDEFDVYQSRIRSLGVDDKVVHSGTEIRTKKLTCGMSKNTVCVFCKNNKETLSVYGTHVLKDAMGRVTCPILRRYTCPICGLSGDKAHTIKYCPFNLTCEGNDTLLKTPRNSFGKKRLLP